MFDTTLDSSHVLRHILLASAVAAVVSTPGLAQNSLALEEVIVTAQKRSESLQDTPISVAAFAKEELSALGVFEPGQIYEYTPNLQITKQPSSQDGYGFSIRGVGAGETSLLNENTVGMYLDGVYIARSTSSVFDVVNLERMEVLRGPQGTLYGRNTIGGAINVITEKPLDEFGIEQFVSVGNRDFFRSKTTIDSGKIGAMFSTKFSYNYNERDGLLNNLVHGNKLGERESNAYRIALRLTPSDDWTVDYTYDNSERESSAALAQIVATRASNNQLGGAISKQATAFASAERLNGLSLPNAGPDKSTFSDTEAHTLTAQWDVNENLTVKYIGAYREWDSGSTDTDFGGFPSDGTTVLADPTVAPGQFVPAGEYVSIFRATRQSDNEQTTHEIQLLGDAMDEKLLYTLGLYYFEEESNEDNPQAFVLPALFAFDTQPEGIQAFLCRGPCFGKDTIISSPIFQYGAKNESVAAFGQFTYSFSEKLDITAGGRYTQDKKDVYLRQSRITDAAGNILDNRADDNWDNVSGSATVNYAWNEDVRTYFTVAQGYRSGGFNARATSVEDFALSFDEETVTNYEIGLKSDWMDSRLRVNAALFYMDYEDAQIASFTAGAAGASSAILNAGELQISGAEIELTAQLSEGLRLMLNYGYTDAEYEQFISQRTNPVTASPSPGPGADPITGNENISDVAKVGLNPENNGSAVLSYDLPPFDFGQLNLRLEATYKDSIVFHPQLNLYDSTEDQTLIHARATFHSLEVLGGDLSISAWGRNLTDEEYRDWGIDFGALGFAVNTFQEKRSYGLDLTYSFGRN